MKWKEHWHKNRDTLYKSQSLCGFFFCLPWCCRNSSGGSTLPVSGRACCGPTWGGTLERSWIPAAQRNLQTVPAPSSVSPDSI